MDIENASRVLGGSILIGLSIIIVVITVVVVNNILHKYWKPIQWMLPFNNEPKRFVTEEELSKIDPK